MKRIIVLSLLTMLIRLCIWAQLMTIAGTVVSEATGQPLAAASVSGGGQTVVTNDDGYFQLKSQGPIEQITVTHVGYRTGQYIISQQPVGELRIRLKPSAVQLQEVLVVGISDPRELVNTAISKIPQNFSQQPQLYHCFYRETAMKRQHYIMVAEGTVDMYKTSYRYNVSRDRVAIRKGRRLLSPRQSDTLSVKVLGGPVTPVVLDIVKNPDILLNPNDLDCYELKMEEPTTIADRQQYVVSIAPKLPMPWALYYGKLYIDQQTLTFTRAEMSLDMSDREKATRLMLVRKPAGVRFRPKELSLLVDYHLDDDGLTYISYVRSTFRFNCDWRRRLFTTSFTAFCEMVVTHRAGNEETVQPINGRESFDQRDAFFDKVDYFRDPTFWQNYNIIEPTESLDRAIDRLLKRYKDQE